MLAESRCVSIGMCFLLTSLAVHLSVAETLRPCLPRFWSITDIAVLSDPAAFTKSVFSYQSFLIPSFDLTSCIQCRLQTLYIVDRTKYTYFSSCCFDFEILGTLSGYN
jgi:hypothetical protein